MATAPRPQDADNLAPRHAEGQQHQRQTAQRQLQDAGFAVFWREGAVHNKHPVLRRNIVQTNFSGFRQRFFQHFRLESHFLLQATELAGQLPVNTQAPLCRSDLACQDFLPGVEALNLLVATDIRRRQAAANALNLTFQRSFIRV